MVEQVRQIYQPLGRSQRQSNLDGRDRAGADLQVAGIEELLVEMLGNLVDNAMRHTPAGGTIRIEGVAAPEAEGVQLAVTDSGPGIPAEFAQRIFDRFTQVPGAETGTGRAGAVAGGGNRGGARGRR